MRKPPNRAHMAFARKALERAANPPRKVHQPRPYRAAPERSERAVTLSPGSSWGTTTNEYLGEGFAIRSHP